MSLRITLLAVPPVLPLVRSDLGLGGTASAVLTNLPVLLLSSAALAGSISIARFGTRGTIVGGLLVVALAGALRGAGASVAVLFAMTFVMGMAVAAVQPVMPTLVQDWHPNETGLATATYVNGLLVGELLSASLTLPLVLPLVGSWAASFVFWSVPVLITAALVAFGTRHEAREARLWRGTGFPDFRNPRLWQLAVFQSSASLMYFGSNTFLPDYLSVTDQPELIAPALASLNACQLPATLVVGLVPLRLLVTRASSYVVGLGVLACLAVVVLQKGGPIIVAEGVLGFLGAYVLVLSFALPAVVAQPGEVSRLAAGVFTISYSMAFLASVVAGAIWDATHQPAIAFLPVLLSSAIVLLLGPSLLRARSASMA